MTQADIQRCNIFHCTNRQGNYCCKDCSYKKQGCAKPCLNDPVKCGQLREASVSEIIRQFQIIRIDSETASDIIDTRIPQGYFYENLGHSRFIGIDNHDGNAWTEEFTSLKSCVIWLVDSIQEVSYEYES